MSFIHMHRTFSACLLTSLFDSRRNKIYKNLVYASRRHFVGDSATMALLQGTQLKLQYPEQKIGILSEMTQISVSLISAALHSA